MKKIFIVSTFIILQIVITSITAAQSSWIPVQSGTNFNLNCITGTYSQFGYTLHAVGDSGTILYSTDNGKNWNKIDMPLNYQNANLNGISFATPYSGFIVSDSGLIFKGILANEQFIINDTIVKNPDPRKKNLHDIYLLQFPNKAGIAVGDSGLIIRTGTGGASWVISSKGRVSYNLRSCWFIDLVHIYTVGDSGTIQRFHGGSWQKKNPPDEFPKINFKSIFFYSDTGFIVGENGAIAGTKNAGEYWRALPSNVTTTLHHVVFGQTINFDRRIGWAVGDSGVILKTTDYGEHWIRQESGTTRNLRHIFPIDGNTVIIVGDSGTVLRTQFGGTSEPVFSATPKTLSFGKILSGSSKIGSIIVTNKGAQSLQITDVTSTNPAFTPLLTSATIPMSGNQEFAVVYSPSGNITETSTITFTGNYSGSPYTIFAYGSGGELLHTGWIPQNPLSSIANTHDIKHTDSSTFFIPGEMGSILRSTNRGKEWTRTQFAGETFSRLNAITFPTHSCGYAVGDNGTIIKTTNSGLSWQSQESRTTNSLVDVSFSNTMIGFAVGKDPTDTSYSTIHGTSDGGITWSTQYADSDMSLNAVFAIDDTTIVAVGSVIVRTSNGGLIWERLYGNYSLNAIIFVNPNVGISVGTGLYRTTDRGMTWISKDLGVPVPITLSNVNFIDENNGFVYGTVYNNGYISVVFRSTDAGNSWMAFANSDQAIAVSLVDHSFGIAVTLDQSDNSYKLMQCVDGVPSIKFQDNIPLQPLLSVSFNDLNQGVAVGYHGTLVRTTNGGEKWNQLLPGTLLEYMKIPIAAVQCINDATITAVCYDGSILRTSDGGMNWVSQTSGTNLPLTATYFLDELSGYCIGSGGIILHTTNGGDMWLKQQSPTQSFLTSVCFTSPLNGIIVGYDGIIMQTSNGGIDWTPRVSGTYAFLASVSFNGQKGIAVGSSGTILRSTDGGITWNRQTSNTSVGLNGVTFSSDAVVTVAGNNGTILRSTDGGLTWSSQLSGTTAHLISVSMLSDNVGTIVGENGTILRTTTGGNHIESSVSLRNIPSTFALEQNYPNPFNPITKIQFDIPKVSDVSLIVYDLLGREVVRLVDEIKSPGHYEVIWDGSHLASGVYFYRLYTNNFTAVKKMLLVR